MSELIREFKNFDNLIDRSIEVNNNGEWFVLHYSQLELCGVDNICNENKFSDDLRKEKEFVKKKWPNNKEEPEHSVVGNKGPGVGCWSHHSVEDGKLQVIDEVTSHRAGQLARSKGVSRCNNPYKHGSHEWVWWNTGWHNGLPYAEYPCPKSFRDVKINEKFHYNKIVYTKVHDSIAVMVPDKIDHHDSVKGFYPVPPLVVFVKDGESE